MRQKHFLLLICLVPLLLPAEEQPRTDLFSVFRAVRLPAGWAAVDSLHIFRGEDLYRWLDGGADVYFEYGFTWAGSRKYASPGGGGLGLEVYEMRDPASAYGMFSSLAGTARLAPYGDAGVGGEGYVVFQKERYVVTITALDSAARPGLVPVARSVDSVIVGGSRRPDLVEALLRPNFHNTAVMAFRGPIAFEDRARLGVPDLFRVRDGAGGIYDSCRTFIIRYGGTVECDTMEEHAARILTSSGGYREVPVRAGRLFQHSSPAVIHLARSGRHLLVTMGEERERVLRVAYMLGRVALPQR